MTRRKSSIGGDRSLHRMEGGPYDGKSSYLAGKLRQQASTLPIRVRGWCGHYKLDGTGVLRWVDAG